jgi:hypothetical protein
MIPSQKCDTVTQGAPNGGGLQGCIPPQTPKTEIKKKQVL